MKIKNIKVLRKQSITLLEVLIASTLSLILLAAINYSYHQLHSINRESEKLYKEQFKKSTLEKRLSSVITQIVSPRTIHKDFYFFTSDAEKNSQGSSLVFTFDNGVTLDKNCSNHVLGRLFLDKQDNLILITLPSPLLWDENPSHHNSTLKLKKEILMENVASLDFEFYVPPKKDLGVLGKKNHQPIEIQESNSWIKSWKAGYNQIPALIKIEIGLKSNDNKTLNFVFPIPKSDFIIMY